VRGSATETRSVHVTCIHVYNVCNMHEKHACHFFKDWESQRLGSNDLRQQYTTTAVIAAVDTTYSTRELLRSQYLPVMTTITVFTTLLAMRSRHYSCLTWHEHRAFITDV